MHNLKKLLSGLLALVMVFGLMACGSQKVETPEDTKPVAEGEEEIVSSPAEAIGSVDLIGTARLTVHYNADGNVVEITGENKVPCHEDMAGTACAKAISQIIQATEGPFASAFVLIKQETNTLVPDDNFLQGIVTEAKLVLGDLPVILSDAADQDDQGYFSQETAKAVLAAYLGIPANAGFAVSESPIDGYYHISEEGSSDNYTVGALYGAVELQLEVGDDFTEDVHEPVDPNTNVDPTEPTASQDDAEDTADEPPVEDEFPDPTEEVIG